MAPGPGAVGPRTPLGAPIEYDYTRWVYWWEYNKNRYLRLREPFQDPGAISGTDELYLGEGQRTISRELSRVRKDDIENRIVPALTGAIAATENRDIQTAALIALAKASRDRDDGSLIRFARKLMQSHEQEVRETAALSLGVARSKAAVPDLEALLRDERQGRTLVGRSEVDERMRAFAAYALGLIAETAGATTKLHVLETLQSTLESPATSSREIKVAVLTAMRVLNVEPRSDAQQKLALWKCLDALDRYYRADLGRSEHWQQAHVPTTVAALLGHGICDDRDRYLASYAHELGMKKRSEPLQQSAALALGSIAMPTDTSSLEALVDASKGITDLQARFFSILALGQVGGQRCRDELLKIAITGRALEKPWAALALGVLEHERQRAGERPDAAIGAALVKMLEDERNPEMLGAAAIGLGLAGHKDAGDRLLVLLDESRQKDELAGHVCIALALLNERRAIDPLRGLLKTAVRRPELFGSAAIALGKLGDFGACQLLTESLEQPELNTARLAALAQALGHIGDRRSIDPLVRLLGAPKLTNLSRAFAAAALGGIADCEQLPWNASLGKNLNYRAPVATLVDHSAGVLDIL